MCSNSVFHDRRFAGSFVSLNMQRSGNMYVRRDGKRLNYVRGNIHASSVLCLGLITWLRQKRWHALLALSSPLKKIMYGNFNAVSFIVEILSGITEVGLSRVRAYVFFCRIGDLVTSNSRPMFS